MTQNIYFIVKPMSIGDTSSITMDGNVSGNQENPYEFTCAGDQDVREGVDRILYGGFYYRLSNSNPQVIGGIAVALQCTGLRDGTTA